MFVFFFQIFYADHFKKPARACIRGGAGPAAGNGGAFFAYGLKI